ncbi:MAG: hypothetical protein EOO51_08020 [Flavobacterium sp.]|nr:MAG: hypothetical protein EOO51_08020 [Flavobacterium sp.]
MGSDINLKELWNKKEAAIPDTGALLDETRRFQRNNLRKLIMANVTLVLSSAFILFVWYYFQPERITTKIGIVLVIAAMAMYLFVYNGMFHVLRKIDDGLSSNEYLAQLLLLRTRQQLMQTRIMNAYFLMLSGGIALYMIEYTSRMSLLWAMVTYGVTFLWILFNWVYIRPRTIRKQREKLDALIQKFESLQAQLSED